MNDRVLVVDDDDAILRLVAPLLTEEALEADCVSNGIDAISRLGTEQYAVVLLDLRMPAGDGFSVIEYLERRVGGGVPPIVLVISAYSDDRLERDLSSGIVTGVIRKPFDPTNLAAVVRRYASKYERNCRRAALGSAS
ncbi:MAG: response regulator [Acidobacteria bacterium]|nr:response regulator [Acidobacteriota bacterium]